MDVVVTTLLFEHVPYFRYTEAVNRRYCASRGYRFVVSRPDWEVARSPIWQKVRSVRKLLTEADYVMFLDADAYVHNETLAVETIIRQHMRDGALLFGSDRRDRNFGWSNTNANCGVFLVRNCPEAFAILDEWWNIPVDRDRRWLWGFPPEQSAFNLYLRTGRWAPWIRIIHYAYINGLDGSFIRHIFGIGEEERLSLLRAVAPGLVNRFTERLQK